MGCAASASIGSKKLKSVVPLVSIFVPSLRVPVQSDLQKSFKGVIPKYIADRISSLRNRIVLVAEDTGGSAVSVLHRALEEYLSLLVGVTKNEHSLQELVEFKWKNLDDGRQEVCIANCWLELLLVVHMMALLTLKEANSLLNPEDYSSSSGMSAENMRNAVDLLVKAAGYLEYSVRDILVRLPPHIKTSLPKDLHEGVLEATYIQALGQGTEMQLCLAVLSPNATLAVKRRLACEQLTFFGQAHYALSTSVGNHRYGKKHLLFIKWKYLEAKAAAYYFHGLILDKGTEPSSHISAVCCFAASEDLLTQSKKACLCFCLAIPTTRAPPLSGAMKHLNKKIPETAARKSQMYGSLLDQEKNKCRDLQILPDLPEFQLTLKPDEYELPEIDSSWNNHKPEEISGEMLKEHLDNGED